MEGFVDVDLKRDNARASVSAFLVFVEMFSKSSGVLGFLVNFASKARSNRLLLLDFKGA